jgi:CBS domain containing-hemolysin-like protein
MDRVTLVMAGMPIQDVLALAREKRLTRFPVAASRDGARRIVGLLRVDSILFRESLDRSRPVEEFITPALFLDADLRLETAMRRMQRAGQPLAIVLDAARREIGIISLQDILRLMFGEVTL